MAGEISEQDNQQSEDVDPLETPVNDKKAFDPNESISIPGIHEPETPENTREVKSDARKDYESKKQEVEANYENRMRDWNALKTELEQFTGHTLQELQDIMRRGVMKHFFRDDGSAERITDIVKTLNEKREEIEFGKRTASEKLLQEFGSSI
jgi:hypothetical protein